MNYKSPPFGLQVNQMKTKKIQLFTFALATVLALGTFSNTQAQLGSLSKVKSMAKGASDSNKAKKIEKSPASADIKAANSAISTLDNFFESQNRKDSYFSKDQKKYESFEKPYLSLKSAIGQIKSKDPKWKTADLETKESTYAKHYAVIKKDYSATQATNDLIKKLEAKRTRMPDEYAYWGSRYACKDLATKYSKSYTSKCPCGDQYYEYYTKVLNVKETRSLLKQLMETSPESVSNSTRIPDLKRSFLDDFQKFKDDAFTEIDNYCTKVSGNSGDTEFEIIVALDYYASVAKTMLEIDDAPEARFTTLLGKIDQSKKTVIAAREKRNKLTAARKGKLFFTKGEISRDDFSDASVIQTVNYGEELNFRFFLAEPTANTYEALPGIETGYNSSRSVRGHVVMKIDGKKVHSYYYGHVDEDDELYRNGLTMRHSMKPTGYGYQDFLMATLPNMTAGNHKLTIEIFTTNKDSDNRISTTKPVATGEVTLVYSNALRSKLLSDAEFCFPKGGMTNASISAKAIALINEKGWKEQPKKAIILEKDWTVVRNKYTGIITKRFVNILIVSTRGGECIKQEFSFYQDNQGGSKYGPLYLSGIGGQDEISCACLK